MVRITKLYIRITDQTNQKVIAYSMDKKELQSSFGNFKQYQNTNYIKE